MKQKIVDEIGRAFNEISGMELSVVDKYFNCLHISKRRGADFCNIVHSCEGGLDICKASDKEIIGMATEDRCAHRFPCPFGIEELVIPILEDDTISGYLVSSMGVNSDKICDEEIARKASELLPEVSYDTFLREISLVPHFSETTLSAYVRLMQMFVGKMETEKLTSNENSSLGSLIKMYVRDNITRRITLADISYYLHRSTVSITQHFKAEYGMTVMQYVTKKRLEIAVNLLETTLDPIKTVAISSGFEEVEYFSRCFKKNYGITPSEYRQRYKEGLKR